MTPCLNWKELEILIAQLGPEIQGLFVEKIVIPERQRFPEGYLKGEWAMRLTGRQREGTLTLSIRPRNPYVTWRPEKGPKASLRATHSAFDLSLSKYLKGAKLLKIETLPKERILILWFSEEGSPHSRLGWINVFIPAAPEAFLVSSSAQQNSEWEILSRSRTIRDESKIQSIYNPPNGSNAPENPAIRHELLNSPQIFFDAVEKNLELEAFESRKVIAQKALRQLMKQAEERLRQSETAREEAILEKDWKKQGDLLKASLSYAQPPELFSKDKKHFREIEDYETGEMTQIHCDPKLDLKEQVQKFYQNAKRQQRRIEESEGRIETFRIAALQFNEALTTSIGLLKWNELERLEQIAGTTLSLDHSNPALKGSGKKEKKRTAWLGKTFISFDKLTIWVGRKKDENLELTFKQARGNDLWMHVKGKPGAHTVISVPTGKSVPLETLLDAANLTIYYSGGESWGKTEIDYTFKKYVKRIKDSSEASYTHNKTLIIEPDLQRIKKLLNKIPN